MVDANVVADDKLSTYNFYKGTYLDGLLQTERVLFAKADAGPFQHGGLFSKVRNREPLILGKDISVFTSDEVINFVQQILALSYPSISF